MKIVLFIIFILSSHLVFPTEKKPEYKWFAAREFYFLIPINQKIYLSDIKKKDETNSFGFGIMGLGNETFSRTGGLQIQKISFNNQLTGENSLYLFDFIFGIKYISQKENNLKFTASTIGDLGMISSGNFYISPIITAGILYLNSSVGLPK